MSRSTFLRTSLGAFAGLMLPRSLLAEDPKPYPIAVVAGKIATDKHPVNGKLAPKLAKLDEIMLGFLTEFKLAGCTIAIVNKEGLLLANRAYGWSDKELKSPMKPDAVMQVGNCEAPLLATAVKMLMVQKVPLPVSKKPITPDMPYFEMVEREFGVRIPQNAKPEMDKITIRDIIENKACLCRAGARDTYDQLKLTTPPTLKDFVACIKMKGTTSVEAQMAAYHAKPEFRPKYEDSVRSSSLTASLCLLRLIVSECSGDYTKFMQEKVLTPAGAIRGIVAARNISADRDPREVYYWSEGKGYMCRPQDFAKGQVLGPATEGGMDVDYNITPAFTAEALARYAQHYTMGSNQLFRSSANPAIAPVIAWDFPNETLLEQRAQGGAMAILFNGWADCIPPVPNLNKLRQKIAQEVLEPNKL